MIPMPKSWKTPKRIISQTKLAKHRKRQSCWLAVDGEVYDVTRYIAKHPGKDTLLKGGGMDATQLFTQSSKFGHDHSTQAFETLE